MPPAPIGIGVAGRVEHHPDPFRVSIEWLPGSLAGSLTIGEIVHGGRASRTWLVPSADRRWVAKLIFDRPEFAVPGLAVSEVVAAAGVRSGRR